MKASFVSRGEAFLYDPAVTLVSRPMHSLPIR